jgi:hypothetical protein
MKKIGYYHIYLTENQSTWLSFAMEQYKIMEDSGLFDALDEFNLVCVGRSKEEFDKILHLTTLYYPSTKQHRFTNTTQTDAEMMSSINSGKQNLVTENTTMKLIYDRARIENTYTLYFHTKGITSSLRHFKNDPHEINLYRNYQYWRHYLNYGVLEKWQECVDALDNGYDVAGINFQTYPHTHYSGNFWWANSNHIASLPNPNTYDWYEEIKRHSIDPWFRQASNRYSDEQWPCSKKNGKYWNVQKAVPNPANVYTPRKNYVI